MRPRALVLLASLAAVACVMGGRLNDYPPATSPQGVQVRIETTGGTITGELLAVDSAGLLVQGRTNSLYRVPFAVARLVEPARGGPVYVTLPERQALRDLHEVRLMSRFPQGVSGDLLRKLLEAYRQDSVVVVQR